MEAKQLRKRNLYTLSFFLLFTFLVSACSNQDENKTQQTATMKEEKESKLPSDKELTQVLKDSATSFEEQDIEKYMSLIHTESTNYDTTKEFLEQLFPTYKFDIELKDMKVVKKNKEEAHISYTQITKKIEGGEFKNNQIKGIQILKPENGKWKLYDQKVESNSFLNESEESTTKPSIEGVEGQYTPILQKINFAIDERQWKLDYYDETQGNFIAEFVLSGETVENWSELYSLQYFEGNMQQLSKEKYTELFQQSLDQTVQGDFMFNILEKDTHSIYYEFTVANDPIQDTQHEVGRIFAYGNDLYIARYTIIGDPLETSIRDQWVERLKDVTIQ